MTDDGGVYSISRMCNLLEAGWVSKVFQRFPHVKQNDKHIFSAVFLNTVVKRKRKAPQEWIRKLPDIKDFEH